MSSSLNSFGEMLQPSEAAEPILARPVRSALLDWLKELRSEEALDRVALKPRRKAMFSGKPGTGKTTLAHHLAARLGLPMLSVRAESIIDCYLGSTGQNIGELFQAAGNQKSPFVLFFDEFDALGHKRGGSGSDVGQERNNYVNTLLKRMEKHDGILIAATNFPDQIDPAIWRRFELHITIDLPGQFEREQILARYLKPFGLPRRELKALAEAFETASPALMRQFCEGLRRQFVLGEACGWDMRREPLIDRLIAAVQPHPDHGKPRLWSHGAGDAAIRELTWPLKLASEIREEPEAKPQPAETVVPFRKAGAP